MVLTIITVIHINLSICVHVFGSVGVAGVGRLCCRLCVTIMQLLHGNGSCPPVRSVAVLGMDRRGQVGKCQIVCLLIPRARPVRIINTARLKAFKC